MKLSKHLLLIISLLTLIILYPSDGESINLSYRLQPPTVGYWFGTDWLGRDVFSRTLEALLYSFGIASCAVILSSIIALVLSIIGNINERFNYIISFLIDAALSLPNLLLLIILTLIFGGDSLGIILAVALSHWSKLTRLCKNEIHSIMNYDYINYAMRFGRNKSYVIMKHALPHIYPQWATGALIMLPHVILHIAGLSFLGFGSDQYFPSIGKMLYEANTYLLTGQWWLVLFPGMTLVLVTLIISSIIKQRQ
ncbi:ABC transporter permease [Vibrio rotiferianus]|uniref:ABC transporter permease n=1 Tax=Vibrio rotiferianus TaxID=190895 RepID=UPI00406AAD38